MRNFFSLFVVSVSVILSGTVEGEAPNASKPYDQYRVSKAAVKGNLNTFAGFVNGTKKSKMYFWFFESEQSNSQPLIVWLQGDIGTSSLNGLFENNGPMYIKKSKGTNSRKHYWSKTYNVLYLDVAVGVGYSHVGSLQYGNIERAYPKDMYDLISNIVESLNSFYRIFNHLKNNYLYLAGDGFACQTLTKLAKRIDQEKVLRLKGLIIENGFCDPINAIPVSNHLHNLQLIDASRKAKMAAEEKRILDLIRADKLQEAFDKYDSLIRGLLTPYKTLFQNITAYKFSGNLLHDEEYKNYGNVSDFMSKENIKHSLNIPKEINYTCSKQLLNSFRGELMKDSSRELGQLLNNYHVLMYFGQMNPEMSPRGAYLSGSSVKWCGEKFFDDIYSPWLVNNKVAGYIVDVRTGDCPKSLTWVMVRNAGKNVAADNPEEVSELIKKFVTQSF